MRVLAVGQRVYLGDLYLAWGARGTRSGCSPPTRRTRGAFGGIIEPVADWRAELPWVGRDGVVLFEGVGRGAVQDALRAEGYRCVGGSGSATAWKPTARWASSAGGRRPARGVEPGLRRAAAAADWLAPTPARYVLKYDDNAQPTFVGEHAAAWTWPSRCAAIPRPGGCC